uniref:Uncharacterized protein n=1 Tax=Anguilla anguilla TaxID=7936 RepID=A0A0E9WB02_ANGAN
MGRDSLILWKWSNAECSGRKWRTIKTHCCSLREIRLHDDS